MDNPDSVQYKIRRNSRAKRMRITVYRDGSVIATVPSSFNSILLEKFINQKKDWILQKVKRNLNSPLRFLKNNNKRDLKKYKDETLILIKQRVDYYNRFYNFRFNKVSIRSQKSRWGSCSKRGNLNFNYNLLFLSEDIRDYIVVHELCHLSEFNHSKNFWALVEKTIPNYREIRRKLKLK